MAQVNKFCSNIKLTSLFFDHDHPKRYEHKSTFFSEYEANSIHPNKIRDSKNKTESPVGVRAIVGGGGGVNIGGGVSSTSKNHPSHHKFVSKTVWAETDLKGSKST